MRQRLERRCLVSVGGWVLGCQLLGCSGPGTDAGTGDGATLGGASITSTATSTATSTTAAGSTSAGPVTGSSTGGALSGASSQASITSGAASSTGSSTTGAVVGGTGGGSTGAGGATGSGGITGTGTQTASGGVGGGEPCVVDHGGEVPSLHEYYADYFAFGAAIDSQYGGTTSLLTKHFNSITAENEMKFDALQASEGVFTYDTARQMVDFAVQNGMQVRGHALVWHRQTPAWVFSGSRDDVLSRMRAHISAVMQEFQGKVQIWDVVNEAIMDDGSYRTNNEEEGQQSGWYGALGESYIAEAFRAARQADPTAKLFYNDYYNYHPLRRQAIYEMLSGLLDAGVPVDGVGLQCHLNLEPGTNPDEQSYHQTVDNLEQAIEMYASLGLEVQITELDVSVYLRGIQYTSDMFYTPATFTPAVQEQQAERYREFFEMFRRHRDVITSVTTWGVSDDNTWLSEFESGRQDFPLLFDTQRQPKPAFWALVDFCP